MYLYVGGNWTLLYAFISYNFVKRTLEKFSSTVKWKRMKYIGLLNCISKIQDVTCSSSVRGTRV